MPPRADDLLNRVIFKMIGAIPFQWGDLRELVTLFCGVVKYLTPLKVTNLLLRESERLKRADFPKGFPFHAVIDTMHACNLQCKYCPTGRLQSSGRNQRAIDLNLLESFLDDMGKYIVMADLFNWGEPLLHPNIGKIVKIFHDRRIFNQISTNLNIQNQQTLEEICDAGLDFLIVSISGMTKNIYGKYHQTGDLDLVVNNLKYIVNYKKQLGYRYPIIELKYLVFKHNIHQIDAARAFAKEIGLDIFRACYAGGPPEEIISFNETKRRLLYPGTGTSCSQLWHTIVLNSDGGIAPCCLLYFKADDFADYAPPEHRNLQDIFSNPRYVAARRMFKRAALGALPHNLQHPCLKCSFVHLQPHLTGYLAANPHAKQSHRTGGP
jgi:pyruvate-formate lyase-activating enzyme